MSLEQMFDALMMSYKSIPSSNQDLKNQNEYLRRQLGEATKQKQKALKSPPDSSQRDDSEAESHNLESTSEVEAPRRPRCERRLTNNSDDFKIDIPAFEGKLHPEESFDWHSTVEQVF